MESPSAKSNSVAMSNSSSKNDEEENHASNPELNSSSSVVAIPPIVPGAQDPLEHLHVANANEVVHDYRCKYCDKRFSTKQALGGHQNAHKIERTMEKNARELRQNQFAYLGGASYPVMASTPSFPGPFNYRAMINRPYLWEQPVHQGVHIGHYAPMTAYPYAPRALYPGWDVQMPSVPRYMEPHVQYNPGFAPVGMGYSSARPVSEAHPSFSNSGLVPGRDPGSQNNNQMNNPQSKEDEDSDLDLTLRI